MMAVRLARAYTGREKILRLREHFHGWNDSVTGQPRAEDTVPRSHGLPTGILDASIVVPQNDIDTLERTLSEEGDQIAAMILEPTGAHWGTAPITTDFVRSARELTRAHGVLLIFDEVITGFRVAPGGAQQEYGLTPDLTTMAKIVAGGLPGGCVAGRGDMLDQIAMDADERISHPGTFNANPLSAVAGAACLSTIRDGAHQVRAAGTAGNLARRMNAVLSEQKVRGYVHGYSSMLHIVIGAGEGPPDRYSWDGAPPASVEHTSRETSHEGVHLMGDGLMVSSTHTVEDVEETTQAFARALAAMKEDGLLAQSP
jgi:glutamate-1-semialdehyde 2,1-aminomutase